jgi:hypothetical protein
MVDKEDKGADSQVEKKSAPVQQFAGQITPGQEDSLKFGDLPKDSVHQFAGQVTEGQGGQKASDVLAPPVPKDKKK